MLDECREGEGAEHDIQCRSSEVHFLFDLDFGADARISAQASALVLAFKAQS